jgi:hypothetical protein
MQNTIAAMSKPTPVMLGIVDGFIVEAEGTWACCSMFFMDEPQSP